MIKACELKKGTIIGIRNMPYEVESLTVTTPSARGAASIYHFRFRNLIDGGKQDASCKGDEPFDEIDLESRMVQYLYHQGDVYSFMDSESYEQFDLREAQVKNQIPYLVDDMEGIRALLVDGNIVAIKMPQKVVLTVVETDPVMKGATITSRGKPATTQTGHKLMVPEYLEQGEEIVVDTESGEYVQRANAVNRM